MRGMISLIYYMLFIDMLLFIGIQKHIFILENKIKNLEEENIKFKSARRLGLGRPPRLRCLYPAFGTPWSYVPLS